MSSKLDTLLGDRLPLPVFSGIALGYPFIYHVTAANVAQVSEALSNQSLQLYTCVPPSSSSGLLSLPPRAASFRHVANVRHSLCALDDVLLPAS